MSDIRVGNFTASGTAGTQSVTGLPFKPTGIIFLWNPGGASSPGFSDDWHISLGAASSPADQWASWSFIEDGITGDGSSDLETGVCLQSSGAGTADLVSFDEFGFTIDWSVAAASTQVIGYMVFGDGIATKAGTYTVTSGTSDIAVTGVGFRPNAMIQAHADAWTDNPMAWAVAHFHNAWGVSAGTPTGAPGSAGNLGLAVAQQWDTGGSVSRSRSLILSAEALGRCDMASSPNPGRYLLYQYDDDGFTMRPTDGSGSSFTAAYFAFVLNGDPEAQSPSTPKAPCVGLQEAFPRETNGTTTSAGTTACRSGFLLSQDMGGAGLNLNGLTDLGVCVGMADLYGNSFAVWAGHKDNVNPTNTASHWSTTKAISFREPPSTVHMEATCSFLVPGGDVRMNYTTTSDYGPDGTSASWTGLIFTAPTLPARPTIRHNRPAL